jgi:NADH-quinone oxidoreductase subunit L
MGVETRMAWNAWLCFLFPLMGALLTPIFNRWSPKLRDWGAVLFSFMGAAMGAMLLPLLWSPEKLPLESTGQWLSFPVKVSLGVLLDPLSIVVANIVAIISFVIMVYCLGYMKGDPGISRFWVLMNLFIGSMLLLVLANDLLFVFVGWKMVGFCSYGLIGYYYRDEKQYWIGGPPPTRYVTPSQAGLKALVVTGVGDLCMLGGMLIIYFYARTFNLWELYQTSSTWIPLMAKSPGTITLVSILLLAGPIGKSAQFPLHEWLPEAMAGPGPVSALIHAATMVKSGVYLVARLVPIFYFGYWVGGIQESFTFFILTAWVGAITAFLAATQGMVALELKKALAYSTVSQIGYMMLGLGVAGFTRQILVEGFTSGIFHLFSHALFKACLFLCAGAVIHAAHSIYMTDMGRLRRYMPFTWFFMLVAALSLMGVPPLPGFWSKDAVLIACWETQSHFLLGIALVTVAITSFYTVRFVGMVFHGSESENLAHVRGKGGHLGEGHPAMTLAYGALAVAIILAGLLGPWIEHFLREGFAFSLKEKLSLPVESAPSSSHSLILVLSLLGIFVGGLPAYFLYCSARWNPRAAEWMARYAWLRGIHKFFWERWYIDRFYEWFFVGGILKLAFSVPRWLEDPWDRLLHKKLPHLVTHRASQGLNLLRTEARDNFLRVAYVLIFFIFCILTFLWGTP